MEYITKETVLKMLNKIENAVEDGEGYQFNEWVGYVEELPTEEVQPIIHAYWKVTDTLIGKCCTCSNCGGCPTMEYRFCPYCGAKMDGNSQKL
jgi:hypothetical protein